MRSTFPICVLLLAAMFLPAVHSNAQWVQTNGPYQGVVFALAVNGTNLFAGTVGSLFLSTNSGTSWTAVNSGLTGAWVRSLAVSDTNLFAGTAGGGVFLSTNNGTSWTAVNSGLTNTDVQALAVNGTNLFAGTAGGGVFLSTNEGTSWTAVNSGLTSASVYALAVSGTNLFAGTAGGGVFLSTNEGTSWSAVNSGLTGAWVRSLAVNGTNLFAGTVGSGVWRRPLSEMITEVESAGRLPSFFRLEQNYPNPFNPSTTIKFELPQSSDVRLTVFDLLGREVTVLVSEKSEAGYHSVEFNASNLSSGVYFYRLHARQSPKDVGGQAGDFVQTRKLLLIR